MPPRRRLSNADEGRLRDRSCARRTKGCHQRERLYAGHPEAAPRGRDEVKMPNSETTPDPSTSLRARRRIWAARHRRWTRHHWARVIFSDESRFILSFTPRRVRVWRRSGEPVAVRQHDRYGGESVMVWGGFSLNHRTYPPSDRHGEQGHHSPPPCAASCAGDGTPMTTMPMSSTCGGEQVPGEQLLQGEAVEQRKLGYT